MPLEYSKCPDQNAPIKMPIDLAKMPSIDVAPKCPPSYKAQNP